jgi:hypothetical protein
MGAFEAVKQGGKSSRYVRYFCRRMNARAGPRFHQYSGAHTSGKNSFKSVSNLAWVCARSAFMSAINVQSVEQLIMPKNTKQTSDSIATLASETLRSASSSAIQKQLAASAMSQASTGKQTGAEMETKASHVLESDKYNATTKALAGSVLSQSNRDRGK